ncbi:cytochrome P450 [Actinoplanes derwentensis]|uniref:Cytochrome P450 n=1 Tax=Actinoplanes derwentensis TaxID=113562 RepID=A0A1H1W9C1_9ACTN|nr:cytochrome P450 [Actinoplanes derwentensis]GID84097.1 cytochrome P450 [Actinoplanes derwentensis]SDS93703.1 Cytochrome P450 [Actinoplanes derwentensis]
MTEPLTYPLAPGPSIHHPSPQMTDLRNRCPVAPVTMPGDTPAYLVTRFADVRQVLVDPRFSRRAAGEADAPAQELGELETDSLIGMDPPEHSRLRRLVSRAFTPRRVEQLRPRVAALVDELIDAMIDGPQPADLATLFSTPLPVQVISELLGIPEHDRHRAKQWSDAMMSDWRVDPSGARAALDGFATLIAARRADPADDLITALIHAQEHEDKLTEHELVSMTVGVLIGGHETTTNLINMALLTLRRHPDQFALLKQDLSRIPAAVEELLRFIQLGDTGVMLPRITTEEVELSGVTLPAGTPVLAAFVTANRDPAVFPDPDRFDIARTPNNHLGFGAGPHHCLGAPLARMELQEALHGLLTRMPDIEVAIPDEDLNFKQGLAVRCLTALPVTW